MLTIATIFGATFLLAQMDPLINPTKFEVNVGWVVAALLGAILYLGRGKIAAWDQHLDECRTKNLTQAGDDASAISRIHTLERQAESANATMNWMADCMIAIGGSMHIELPARPQLNRRKYDEA